MAKNIIFDTGYWFALYDSRDSHHEEALLFSEYISPHRKVIPWPSLYETLNTRFVRRQEWLYSFKSLIADQNTILIHDEKYRDNAIKSVFFQSKSHRKLSLVDLVIREILLDVSINIDAIFTFNISDFEDICWKRNIELFDS
jgi:predicted nucleic acid-binding protein